MSNFFNENVVSVIFLILQLAIIFLLPQVFVILSKKYKFFKFLSPIILCYLGGIILGNILFFPWNAEISMTISEISVPIAIALILFSADIIKWLKLGKITIKSFTLVLVAALVSSLTFGIIFADKLPDGWKVAGMLTGCYTGGTPNLVAIGKSLALSGDKIVLVNMCDMLCGGVYFLLLGSVLIRLYRKILPKFDMSSVEVTNQQTLPALEPIFADGLKVGWKNTAFAVAMAVLATGVSVGIAMLITGKMDTFLYLLCHL